MQKNDFVKSEVKNERVPLVSIERGKDSYVVTEKAVRQEGEAGKCHFCGQPVGEHHKSECETVRKTVSMYVAYVFHIPVPYSTDEENMGKIAGKIYREVDDLLHEQYYTDERFEHEECYPFDAEWEESEGSFLNETFDQPEPVLIWP